MSRVTERRRFPAGEQHRGKGLHTTAGARRVLEELREAKDRTAALDALAKLKQLIVAGNLLPGYVPKPTPKPKKPPASEPTECIEEDE